MSALASDDPRAPTTAAPRARLAEARGLSPPPGFKSPLPAVLKPPSPEPSPSPPAEGAE